MFWVAGTLIMLFLPYSTVAAIIYPWLNLCYSFVCHQNPAKTMSFDGLHLLVCSRCFGIYAGALFSSAVSLLIPVTRRSFPFKYFYLALIPMLMDIALYSLHVYNYSKIIAFFTGLLLGSTGFFYILNGIEEFIAEIKQTKGN